jgi:APA family basic amino acid/polyamine antiporter
MRTREPHINRPVKVPFYPLLPALYLLGASAVMIALLIHKPAFTWPGLAIVGMGVPVYFLTNRKEN